MCHGCGLWAGNTHVYFPVGTKTPVISTGVLPDQCMIALGGYATVNNNNTNTLFKYNCKSVRVPAMGVGESYTGFILKVNIAEQLMVKRQKLGRGAAFIRTGR